MARRARRGVADVAGSGPFRSRQRVSLHGSPGQFVDDPQAPYEMFADFLDDVVDPLVAAGRIQWATFSQMADAFEEWEADHPGVDPRSLSSDASHHRHSRSRLLLVRSCLHFLTLVLGGIDALFEDG